MWKLKRLVDVPDIEKSLMGLKVDSSPEHFQGRCFINILSIVLIIII